MRYKDICKWIKQEAKKLPEEGYMARAYYHKPPKESENPLFVSEDSRVFSAEEFKCNHSRRLKNIWKKTKDFNGLNKYFLKFGFNLNYQP